MARIPVVNNFQIVPEGEHVFRIYDATYDEQFGIIEIKMITAEGLTHTERFHIMDSYGQMNDKALGAFSYFAKNAMNNFYMDDIDTEELIGHYIKAEVIHTTSPSRKDPSKMMTFANLGDKSPADGFEKEPCERAKTISRDNTTKPAQAAPAPAPAQPAQPAPATGLDLDSLLDD